ncbi:ubiquinol oxidase subunit II, cyanide insensitive [Tistrella bauzanensis]|uniref:Ubiquinol oxidase subunit II, cyanide insensitive n=1 Tax=Tistrella bauzanensis TaxID=657419 RepID=A0ABQ1II37_9PROT|nr:cytochrome d ubiquinol oxidase subunit II [Tistrella bauzanensis]GGB42714.1 ubiquinol oxidase subunit II, cyanide insensitive [Tistrella bauzanensis]
MTGFFDLPTIWAFVIAFAVFAYVVMDGFDLGLGILFPGFKPGPERSRVMNTVAPVWDGNETWLVLGGGGLMAAFPLAYAIVLPALYAPIIAMLLGLIFRGVAFEFRWRDPRHRRTWDIAFTAGSIVATFAQGVTLGALLQGIAVEGRAYAGGWWDWLTPFSLLVGASLVIGYALLGATWLIMKTDGVLQLKCYTLARNLGIVTLICMATVSAATPFLSGAYYEAWFAWPRVLFTAQVPLLVLICTVVFFIGLRRGWEFMPFLMALAFFTLGLIGLGVSIFPHVVPQAVTIWQAAAPDDSLIFMLVGAVVLIPIILAYTGYAYWVFRGKTGHEGYH